MLPTMSDTEELQAWMAKAIKAEAAVRGVSIRQLGLRSGISDKVLRRALDSERPFHLGQLIKIADTLEVSLSYLTLEAERRQEIATPTERAAAVIESDTSLTRSQKRALLGAEESSGGPVSSDQ